MPSEEMMKAFSKKKAPKFEDEGPPEGEDSRGGEGSPDMREPKAPDSEEPGADGPPAPDPGTDPSDMALDDIADILGVGPEDRDDLAAALDSYVSSKLAELSGGPPGMGDEPESVDGAQMVQGMPQGGATY